MEIIDRGDGYYTNRPFKDLPQNKDLKVEALTGFVVFTDESIMTFGIHKGKSLANVPASYLVWLYENNKCFGALKVYIAENIDDLRLEAKI